MTNVRIEAERMVLANYQQVAPVGEFASNNSYIRLNNENGSASFVLPEDFAAGFYHVNIGYYDELDGRAQLSVELSSELSSELGSRVLETWTLDQDLNGTQPSTTTFIRRTLLSPTVIQPGDEIKVLGTRHAGERAAVDYLELELIPPTPVRIEAETLTLRDYSVANADFASGGKLIKVSDNSLQGTATATWTGIPGTYNLTVAYYDESDGVAPVEVRVDGILIESWSFDRSGGGIRPNAGNLVERTLSLPITLNPNSTIELKGTLNAGEPARIDYFQFNPVNSQPPTNTSPVAVDDSYSGVEDSTLNVPASTGILGNDTDVNGDLLNVNSYSNPSNTGGSVLVNPDGSFSYTPAVNFVGSDSFSYTVSDGQGGTDTAVVNLTIAPQPSSQTGIFANLTQGIQFTPNEPWTDPLKIMPLGDSITQGVTAVNGQRLPDAEQGGYRTQLWTDLTTLGLEVDFVGSGQNGPAGLGDKDHEGHPGWQTRQIQVGQDKNPSTPSNGGVDQWLPDYKPDVVLLMIGTNDASGTTDNTANMKRSLERLLNDIDTLQGPETELFLATIPPIDSSRQRPRRAQNASAYNQIIRNDIVPNYNLTLVDVGQELTVNDLAARPDNGLHPSPAGYDKIADLWFDALLTTYGTVENISGVSNLTGSPFNDVLTGNTQNNRIEGGTGNDELTGGGGADTFVYGTAATGIDQITDFNPTTGDQFAIAATGFGGGLTLGTLLDHQLVQGTTAQDLGDRFLYDGTTGNLFFDIDGLGGNNPIALATLTNRPAFTAAQIVIV